MDILQGHFAEPTSPVEHERGGRRLQFVLVVAMPTVLSRLVAVCGLSLASGLTLNGAPPRPAHVRAGAASMVAPDIERKTGDNVEQIKDTSRDKVMTFSYDMSLEPEYEKPTYPGTGNGQGGDSLNDEYDVIVIGSGMGGLACGALSQEYGSKVAVLESHIKPGGSAHTFSRMHKGGKYSFEVGPSIFEGLNGPSLNPLRTILDMLGEELVTETYYGLGYWTPEGYWRFPIGSAQKFEDLIYERCGKEEGDKAVEEWAALRKRLKTLGGSTTAVSLVNLRQARAPRWREGVEATARDPRAGRRCCSRRRPPCSLARRRAPTGGSRPPGVPTRRGRTPA